MKFTARLVAVLLSAAALLAADVASAQDAGVFRDPDAEAALQRGQVLLEQEEYSRALDEFNAALAIDDAYEAAYIGRGDALQGLEDYRGAAAAYTDALEFDARSAAAYNGRGEVLLETGQVDLAINDFRNALDLDRNNAKILSNLGHVTVNNLGNPVVGIRLLDEALAANEEDARAYRDRGLAHAMLKDFESAEADIRRAGEVEPGNHENFMTLASIFLYQEKLPESIEALTQAIAVYEPKQMTDPDTYVSAILTRGNTWVQLGNKAETEQEKKEAFEQAIADANAVLAEYEDRFPESGSALFLRGIAQRMLGQYLKSIDSLTRAIQAVPPGEDANYVVEAYLRRGIAWFYQGSIELARGDFEQAGATGDGFRDPRVYLWIGYTYFKDGDLRTAIDYYGEALAKSPEFALAHVNRGIAYMQLQEYKKALGSFSDAIRVEPDNGEHYYRAGMANRALEEYRKALDMFNLAVLKDSNEPKYRKAAAEMLEKLGESNLADQWLREAEQLPTE
ncbi:MAG: hypothetical protein CMJ58_27370 [Planctomycetaceae bacterium]|nr:hypothetical protein [Planctomycetaceae bacterium]